MFLCEYHSTVVVYTAVELFSRLVVPPQLWKPRMFHVLLHRGVFSLNLSSRSSKLTIRSALQINPTDASAQYQRGLGEFSLSKKATFYA